MANQVVMGAMMSCSFGTAPGSLLVTSNQTVLSSSMPAATIMDFAPIANIPPFAMCTSIANPQVASATAAAFGVLTPMPCVPVTTGPWVPGAPTCLIAGQPALTDSSQCFCAWGGVIQISFAGQVTETVA
jgi:hypothetical protein